MCVLNLESIESCFLADAIAISGNCPTQKQLECGHMAESKQHHKFCTPPLSSYCYTSSYHNAVYFLLSGREN